MVAAKKLAPKAPVASAVPFVGASAVPFVGAGAALVAMVAVVTATAARAGAFDTGIMLACWLGWALIARHFFMGWVVRCVGLPLLESLPPTAKAQFAKLYTRYANQAYGFAAFGLEGDESG